MKMNKQEPSNQKMSDMIDKIMGQLVQLKSICEGDDMGNFGESMMDSEFEDSEKDELDQ